MEMNDSEEELFPIDHSLFGLTSNAFYYNDPCSLSGLLKAVFLKDLHKVKELLKEGKSININDNNGNTPLHLAVIKFDLEILNFLLIQDDIVVNIRNFMGETPLFLAVKHYQFEAAKCLIDHGANVNLPNFEDLTPLHVSVISPKIARLLLSNSANVDARDFSDDTPLHDAIIESSLEVVSMLLYYNADANSIGGNGLTPFMKALITLDARIQTLLINYVSDFNAKTRDNMSVLDLAVTHSTPYLETILDRGAKITASVFSKCITCPSVKNFKLIWDRLEYDEEDPIDLTDIFEADGYVEQYLNIIVNSPNFKLLDENILPNLSAFLMRYFEAEIQCVDKLTKFICLLLQNSYRLQGHDLYLIFSQVGFCELIKILQYMEHDNMWTSYIFTTRMIFDIYSTIETLTVEIKNNSFLPVVNDIFHAFQYHSNTWLVEYYLVKSKDTKLKEKVEEFYKSLGVPSLIELARNKSREYIVKSLNFKTNCQYYTYVNHMNIPFVCKKILTFEKKLY